MAGFLVVNPHAGGADPALAEALCEEAERRGLRVHVLAAGEDAEELARAVDADVLGSPAATGRSPRLQRSRSSATRRSSVSRSGRGTTSPAIWDWRSVAPIAALAAFEGRGAPRRHRPRQRRAFLNNVSLGLYAGLVHRRAHHRLRRESLATMRALVRSVRDRHPLPLVVDGRPLVARVVLVANNAYEHDLFSLGARPRLDEGRLHLYAAGGVLPGRWEERTGVEFASTRPTGRFALRSTASTPSWRRRSSSRSSRGATRARSRQASRTSAMWKASSSFGGSSAGEPRGLRDIVGGLEPAAEHARRPVEVQRGVGAFRVAVPIHPHAEERLGRHLEAGLLEQFAAQGASSGCSPSSRKPPGRSQ